MAVRLCGLKAQKPIWVVGIAAVVPLVMLVQTEPGVEGMNETATEVERQIGIPLPRGMVMEIEMHLRVGLMHEMVVTLVEESLGIGGIECFQLTVEMVGTWVMFELVEGGPVVGPSLEV